MRRLPAVLAVLLSLHAFQGSGAQGPDDDHILGDLCSTPARWKPPLTRAYHLRNGGTVVFVAVEHVKDPRSPTIARIRAAFGQFKPGMMLVEGASLQKSADGNYLKFLADTANRQYAAGRIQENMYAVKLAADNQVRYMGWDLSPHEEYVADIANGFDIGDAIGAHLLRDHLDPFGAPSSAVLQAELDSVPRVRQPAGFDYGAWYRVHYGDSFDPTAGTPCGKGIASRIVKFESVRRTLNIVRLVDTYAGPGSVVMVEAGANHWLALREYLTSISENES